MAQQKWICRKCKKELPSMSALMGHIKDLHGLKLVEEQR